MKHLKKLMALMIAVVMCIAMAVPTMAEDTKYAITVDTSKDAVPHNYDVYQIFTGTPKDGKLVDLKYGSSYTGKSGAVPKTEIDAIGTTSDAVRAWIETTFGDGAENIGTAVATLNADNTSYDAVPGYYLVLDKSYTATDDTKDAYSAFMIQVVDKATPFTPKKNVPEVDKQVKDETDDAESGATDGWGETADYEIGETFQFKLIATIPADENLKAYKTYKVQFNDKMCDAIAFEKINSVKVNGTPIAEGTGDGQYVSSAVASELKEGGTWTLTINDIKKVNGIVLGNAPITIEVEYDAHLNENAYVNDASGATTNENEVTLTYSNNPDATGTGNTDTTPEDKVFVFTYKNTGTKVDANNQPVAGAGFVLYKIDAADAATIADSTDTPTGTVVPLYKNSKGYLVYNATNAAAYTGGATVADNEIITTDTDGGNVFSIVGLDVGTYALYEKTVPEGYTQAKNTVFTITADHSEAQKDVPNVDLGNSTVSETIKNYTGSTLPSTGGIGTTIFYVIGAVLVVGAGIVLVTRRRMSAN